VLPRVETELRAQGVEPNFVFRSDIIGTVQALVGAGVGNAIVPRLAVDFADNQVSVVELGPDVPVQPRVIALFWHRDRYRSPASLGFVEAAREVCAQVTAELDGDVRPLHRRARSA
jgi:DNA-binding transcriptional LysR family regulator